MKNCFKTTVFFFIGFLIPGLTSAQLILERQPSEVVLSGTEQVFVQKITSQSDTKTAKYISIGDIGQYQSNGMLSFSLPGVSETLQSEAVHVEYISANYYIWSARFTNLSGYMSIISKPEGKVGFFQLPGRFFSIYPINDTVSLLKEIDFAHLSSEECGWVESEMANAEIDWCEPEENDCFSEIDVLILVSSPDIQNWFNTQGNPWQAFLMVIQGIESVNLAFANSGIANKQIRWRAEQFNFTGYDMPLNPGNDIIDLANQAAPLREQRQADVVIMLTANDYPGIAGIASGPSADCPTPSENCAYAIVEIQSIADPRWTFAHEFAHLLGARHNRPTNCSAAGVCGNDNTNVCSHAWVFNDQNGTEQRTILATLLNFEQTAGAMRIPHYSNPNVNFNGAATGTADNDNARIMRNTACHVDDYNRAEWNVGIQGPPKWCLNLLPEITFSSVVTPPNQGWGLPGNPPYQYEWRASCSPTFNPSTFLSSQSSITLSTPFCEPVFWLQLTVTSSDGAIRTVNRRVGVVEDCPHFQGGGEDRTQPLDMDSLQTVIYPNPARDNMVISNLPTGKGQCATIVVSDNLGKVVREIKSCESKTIELPTKNMPAGIYFVKIHGGNNQSIHKIIVQK